MQVRDILDEAPEICVKTPPGGKEGIRTDATLQQKNGTVIPVEISSSCRGNVTEEGFLLTIRDLSAIKEQERLLEEERLKTIHRSKLAELGIMASGIAHEINNPLTIIDSSARIIYRTTASDAPDMDKVQNQANRITNTVSRITSIIRGLRAFSRDGSNDPMAEVSVHELIQNTLEFCRERFRKHNVKLIESIDSDSLSIRGQMIPISQVLLNLLHNAFDAVHCDPDGWVRVEVQDIGDSVILRVLNSGEKISPEIAAKVFNPFFTTKDVDKGTGLGLSISHGIIESHGGTLALDKGHEHTCFTITLPKFVANSFPSAA
jgi:C4-dicarboxylate-specific signal transduction histidine kinase